MIVNYYPISSSLPLPINLHVEVVKAVSIELDDAADVTFVDLFVSPATADSHSDLKTKGNVVEDNTKNMQFETLLFFNCLIGV
jgi:hypothetical protein